MTRQTIDKELKRLNILSRYGKCDAEDAQRIEKEIERLQKLRSKTK